jgi:Ca2+-binding EF-hand superfamily protein
MSDKTLDEVLKRFDNDQDGAINFDEFIYLVWTALVERRRTGD